MTKSSNWIPVIGHPLDRAPITWQTSHDQEFCAHWLSPTCFITWLWRWLLPRLLEYQSPTITLYRTLTQTVSLYEPLITRLKPLTLKKFSLIRSNDLITCFFKQQPKHYLFSKLRILNIFFSIIWEWFDDVRSSLSPTSWLAQLVFLQ